MRYIESVAIIFLCITIVSGCAGTGESKKEAETGQLQPPQEVISPEARQKYNDALDAMRNGDNDKAKDLLLKLSKTYPELSGPYTNLGLIYFREGKIDEAEAVFLQAIKVNSKSAVSYNHLGIISREKGNFQEAKAHYQQALKINNDYAYAHLNIGILYDLYLGQLDKALDHYNRFQSLSAEKDPEVEKWIVDLERRLKASN